MDLLNTAALLAGSEHQKQMCPALQQIFSWKKSNLQRREFPGAPYGGRPPPADGGAPVTAYLAELCAKTSNLQPDPSEWDQETVEEPDSDDEEGEKIRSWCVLEGLPDGIKYKFRVAACNIVGWGVMSDVLLLEKESNQGEDEGQSGDGSDEDGDDEEENSNDTSSGEEESSESSSGEQQSAGNNID
mmetsp:Transcript_35482/g.55730  ORF Transcript_35482/g.55730 Transcript_35482/m.55730 type:complete len:187 (-) Transcript_35482:157-717(-)